MRPRGRLASVEEALTRNVGDLRGRLVVAALAAVAVLVALALAFVWRQYEHAKDEAASELRARAVLAATVFDTYFAGQLEALRAIAASPVVASADVDAMTSYFARFRPGSGTSFTAGVGWIDLRGRQRATSAPDGPVPSSLADRSYFKRVVATRKPFVGEAIVARTTQRRLIVMGVPTRDARGTLRGVLAGGIVLQQSSDDVRTSDLGYEGLEIIDRQGQQVTRRDLASPVNRTLVSELRQRREGVIVDREGLDGSGGRVVGFATAATPRWLAVLDQSESVVFADARRALVLESALVAAAASLVLVLIGWAVRRSRRSLRSSRAQVRRWATLTRSLNATVDTKQVTDVLAGGLAAEFPEASVAVRVRSPGPLEGDELSIAHGRRATTVDVFEANAAAIIDVVVSSDEPVLGTTHALRDREQLRRLPARAAGSLYGVSFVDERGQPNGAVVLLFGAERALGDHELILVQAHAEQAQQALMHVRRYEEQHDVAVLLQESLLPSELPETEGLEIAAHYRAGALNTTVGGDWYDVVRRPDGIVHLTVGDVAGRGIDAAISMGQLRNAFRAYALEHESPGAVVQRLARHVPGDAMATTICATYDPYTRELVYASAGHVPPLVLDPGERTVRRLDHATSGPLGWGVPGFEEGVPVAVPVGATLVLFTDGLVERRDLPLDQGIDRLAATLAKAELDDLQTALTTLLNRVVEPRTDDDLAVLLVRLGAAPSMLRIQLPAAAEQLHGLRRRVRAWLTHRGVEPALHESVVLAVSEACNNSIEHGYRDWPGSIAVRLEHRGDALVISVEDDGTWREPRDDETRGRGFVLMQGLMDAMEVVRRPHGTRIVLQQQL